MLPFFRKSEHNERMEDRYHGRGGPLNVADHRFRHPLSEMFVAAAQETGVPANADFNGAGQDGCGFYQVTQKDGLRWSTASAFLRPGAGAAEPDRDHRRADLPDPLRGAARGRRRVRAPRAVGAGRRRRAR